MNRNHSQNQVAQKVKAEEERQFEGANALRLSENYTFGPQATEYIQKKYAHLQKQSGKLVLSGTKYHPHPYAAFCRKLMNRTVVLGMAPHKQIVDVGGHAIRTSKSEREFAGIKGKWHDTIHSMLPVMDANDELRHAGWKDILESQGLPYPMPNSCGGVAGADGLCQCTGGNGKMLTDTSVYMAVDSAYYPGVMEGMIQESFRTGNPSYFAFHDYYQAYVNGNYSFETFDGESKVELTDTLEGFVQVRSQVNGNPFYYEHGVVNTCKGESWYMEVQNNNVLKYAVFTVQEKMNQGCHDYILVKMNILTREPVGMDRIDDLFAKSNIGNVAQRVWQFKELQGVKNLTKTIKDVSATALSAIKRLIVASTVYTRLKTIEVDRTVEGEIIVVRKQEIVEGDERTVTYRVKPADLSFAYKELIDKYDATTAMRVYKRLANRKNEMDPNTIDYTDCRDAVVLAQYMTAKDSVPVYEMVFKDVTVEKARKAQRGDIEVKKKLALLWRWLLAVTGHFRKIVTEWLKDYILSLVFVTVIFAPILIAYYTHNKFLGNGVAAAPYPVRIANQSNDLGLITAVIMAVALIKTVLKRRHPKHVVRIQCTPPGIPQTICGTCVTDKRRLDISLNRGRVDPQWKFNDPDWDIRGMNGEKAAAKLGCDRQNREEAVQIGPIIDGSMKFRPTIKHCCKQVTMAASIRACSNLIEPDPVMIEKWEGHFGKIEGAFRRYIQAEGGLTVCLEKWLQKYPEDYREKILKAYRDSHSMTKDNWDYKSFPKKEMQFTDVPAEWKEDDRNTVKERQISGPEEEKKLIANALIYELEGIAHRHMEEYCGRKNWEEICSTLEKNEARLVDFVYGFADGSGFDMTQIKRMQQRFTRFMKALMGAKIISLPNDIDPKLVIKVFENSETLKVKVGQGEVSYKTEGRASGDGWTTFGNTLLMISYWTFVFAYANIPKTAYFLLVKGDDVLFAVERKYVGALKLAISQCMAPKNELRSFGLGQVCKFVKWGDLEDGDFLSNRFFRNGTKIRMMRIPKRVFQTLPWSMKTSTKDVKYGPNSRELLYSKGMSLKAWANGLPIFGVLADKLISLGKEGKLSEFNEYADGARIWTRGEKSDYIACADWMTKEYGITYKQILEAEVAIQAITSQLAVMEVPVVDAFYSSDE